MGRHADLEAVEGTLDEQLQQKEVEVGVDRFVCVCAYTCHCLCTCVS